MLEILLPVLAVIYIITQLIWPLLDSDGFIYNWLFKWKEWQKYRKDVREYKEFLIKKQEFFQKVVEVTRNTAHQ